MPIVKWLALVAAPRFMSFGPAFTFSHSLCYPALPCIGGNRIPQLNNAAETGDLVLLDRPCTSPIQTMGILPYQQTMIQNTVQVDRDFPTARGTK